MLLPLNNEAGTAQVRRTRVRVNSRFDSEDTSDNKRVGMEPEASGNISELSIGENDQFHCPPVHSHQHNMPYMCNTLAADFTPN